jgi:hypothetical protein
MSIFADNTSDGEARREFAYDFVLLCRFSHSSNLYDQRFG